MPVELKVAGSNPGVVNFFSPSSFFFSFPFFPFLFFSPLVSFFSSPFHYPLQARSATSMLKHFSSNNVLLQIAHRAKFLLSVHMLEVCLRNSKQRLLLLP